MSGFDKPTTVDEWRKDGVRYRIRRSCPELGGRIWLEEREAIAGSSWRRFGIGTSAFRILRRLEAVVCQRVDHWLERVEVLP